MTTCRKPFAEEGAIMIRTALALARKGLRVLPCVPRGKRPATTNGLKDATTDPAQIRAWWRHEPALNVAIATGVASGVFVVDVDGLDGELALRRLEAEHGALPPTIEAITGHGRHIYFAMPDTPVRNTASRIGDSIDTRGDGGYALVPPSVHPSGRRYSWSVDCGPTIAHAPAWLLARIGKPNGNGATATPPAQWRDLVLGGVGEGRRNDTVTRLAGYLLRRHVDPLVALEFLATWNAVRCQPPLDAAEVAGIVDSIAGRELKRRGAG
jgi:Bifunctional DNA primase/polymerase, N-terminal/Primase C terminal 1 (PriCT-1)